jgi:glutamyl-tRNA synthetase
MKPRLRFAPSPSGYLHIGGARTALFGWLWARKAGGSFVVRVEDTDQDRSSLDSVRAILDAMKWLGLDWDEGPEVGGPHGPYFQSERKPLYRELTEKLIAEGRAYRCYCTKEELDRAREELKARDPKAQFVYPGTCRDRKDQPDLPFVVRFKSPREGSTDFVDKVFGAINTPNSAQQDFVLVRTDGYPLYNLAATIDDHEMGITVVTRARDHIGNTPQQLLLYQAFGWQAPDFAHFPMMLAPSGEKLSKRHGSVSVQEYRERGYTPTSVLNYLVRFGWSHGDQEIFSRQDLIDLFDWQSVNKSDGKFDEKKFADVAFEHLKQENLTPLEEYVAGVRPFLEKRGLRDVSEDTLRKAIPGIRDRARTLVDAAHHLDYYFREPPELDPKARDKFMTPAAAEHVVALADALGGVEPWQPDALEQRFREFLEQRGVSMKDASQATRVALSGRSASPPLFEVMAVLGRERSLSRMRRAPALVPGAQAG